MLKLYNEKNEHPDTSETPNIPDNSDVPEKNEISYFYSGYESAAFEWEDVSAENTKVVSNGISNEYGSTGSKLGLSYLSSVRANGYKDKKLNINRISRHSLQMC